jgi:hypothetical protein
MNILYRIGRKLYDAKYKRYERLLSTGQLDNNSKIASLRFDKKWEQRINLVLDSPENKKIPRNKDAGKIEGGFQIMHNGIQILTGGYYGLPIAKMLYLNKGVHEPEEERIFGEIIKKIPQDGVMIEMGAYWAFYSMWFLKEIKQGKAFMIEAEQENLEVGKKNFEKNGYTGEFEQFYISKVSNNEGPVPSITLDDIISKKNLTHVSIAHSDIQGYEVEMLDGAKKALAQKMVDYFFISTHGTDLHKKCLEILKQNNYKILHSIDLAEISSEDGLIVAVSPNI